MRAAIYALARVPDDVPCSLSDHMAWTRSSCIAKQDLPTLDSQYTDLAFLLTRLPDQLFDTTSFNVAVRPPIAAHS